MTEQTADVELHDYRVDGAQGVHRPGLAMGGHPVRLWRLRTGAQGQAAVPVAHG